METENKIIKHLIETKKELTIRELSKNVKSDYKIVNTAIHRLIQKDILEGEKVGNSLRIKLRPKLSKEILSAEFERRENILKNKNLNVMLESLRENLSIVNFIILLFGSYAKDRATKISDIDLIFIIPEANFEKEIEKAVVLLPLKIHSLVFTEKQFTNMKNSNEPNVVKEAIKSNIILQGIEQYYSLLNKK